MPGSWRHERGMRAYGERLVSNMLVAISGSATAGGTLTQPSTDSVSVRLCAAVKLVTTASQ